MATQAASNEHTPFETTRDIGARLHRVTDQLDTQSGLWGWALTEGAAAEPLRSVLMRALLLVGAEPVLIADGTLGETDEPDGFALLVTPTRLVRARFNGFKRQNGWPSLEANVEAIPLAAVQRVSALAASQGRHEDSPWPNLAQVVLHLDRELAGVTEITLPEKATAARQNSLEVAKLVARLPLG